MKGSACLFAFLLAASAWLGGCATAPVLKEDAAAVSAATRATVAASRDFYARLGTSRRNYLVEVIAHSPGCQLDWNVVLAADSEQPYGVRCLTDDEKATRAECLAAPGSPCPAGLREANEFVLVGDEHASALALVEAMADYQVLLARILEDPEFDATAPLLELQATVGSAQALVAALGGKDQAKPWDFSEQAKAIGALSDLVNQTAEDHRDLAQLRELLAAPNGAGARFEASLARLALRYENLDRKLLVELDRAQLESQRREVNARLGKLAPDKRADAMRPVATAYAELRRRAAAPDALAEAFQALADNQQTLRRAVVDGELSAEQRHRVAAASLRQLRAWFDAIRSLVTVF